MTIVEAADPLGGAHGPRGVGGHRQAPSSARSVLDRQHADLQSVVQRNELQEVQRNPVTNVLEAAVAGTVSGHVGGSLGPDRQGGRTPQLAGLVVPDVDGLAHRVGYGVVRPRCELVLAAVL